MASSHWFNFGSSAPQVTRKGGSRIDLRSEQLPALKGFSLSLLTLEPKGVREPHWHSNASELSYCLEGRGLMTIFTPSNDHETFPIEAGDVVFVPRNFLHHIENSGSSPLKMLLSFDNELATSNEISSGIQKMSADALGALFKQSPSFFTPLQKEREPALISTQTRSTPFPYASIPNRFKYNLAASIAPIQTPGGWVKAVHSKVMPMLCGLSVYSLNIAINGFREPHWHPNCSELNYVVSGKVRITLMFPGGDAESFDLGPGDISYLPEGYLHNIVNIGAEEASLIVFFNNELPADIGLSGAVGAYSNEILASLFGVTADYFEGFPKYQKDLRIVAGGG